jgi:hypothetical protein
MDLKDTRKGVFFDTKILLFRRRMSADSHVVRPRKKA